MARCSDETARPSAPDEWEWDDFATGDFESGEDDRI